MSMRYVILPDIICILLHSHYQNARSAPEHMVMIFALMLETRDIAKNTRTEATWTIPEELNVSINQPSREPATIQLHNVFSPQNNLRVYANAFLLSPVISYYRGKLPEALIVSLLCVYCICTDTNLSGRFART